MLRPQRNTQSIKCWSNAMKDIFLADVNSGDDVGLIATNSDGIIGVAKQLSE